MNPARVFWGAVIALASFGLVAVDKAGADELLAYAYEAQPGDCDDVVVMCLDMDESYIEFEAPASTPTDLVAIDYAAELVVCTVDTVVTCFTSVSWWEVEDLFASNPGADIIFEKTLEDVEVALNE